MSKTQYETRFWRYGKYVVTCYGIMFLVFVASSAVFYNQFHRWYLILLMPPFVYWIAYGLTTGRAKVRNITVYKSENPSGYWLVILMLLALAVLTIVLGFSE